MSAPPLTFGRFHHTPIACIPAAALALLAVAQHAPAAPPRSDFNGDGFDDLAIGMPNMDVGQRINAGGVQIIFGGPAGADLAGNRVLTQESPGVPDAAEDFDRFGSALAWGDFNGDGFSDLAIGTPQEDVGNVINAGSVTVMYGSPTGLDPEGPIEAQHFAQGRQGLLGTAENDDQFGWSLAAGDFDGDGLDDLAIGIVSQDIATSTILAPNAGAVHVLYGRTSGLSAFADEVWSHNAFGVPDVARFNDRFGWSLATGDFDGDGRDDLAIGVPGKALPLSGGIGAVGEAGAAVVIYGSNSGLRGAGAQMWSQNSTGIPDSAETGDRFGFALAAGDFDGDGRDDLAIAAPFEDAGLFRDAGIVHIVRGTNVGLRAADNAILTGSGNLQSLIGDTMGFALAAADFDGDGRADLAAGLPRVSTGFTPSAGGVMVFRGSATGLAQNRRQFWWQDSRGVRQQAETQDRFGESLWTGDFNADGRADLAIGVPRENIGFVSDAGAVHVLLGAAARGLTQRGDLLIHPGMTGLAAPLEFGGFFGFRTTVTP